MFNTRELQLKDREHINRLLKRCQCDYSSHAFDSLYLWRQSLDLTVYTEEELFAVKCGKCGRNQWYFPCGERDFVKRFLEKSMEDRDFELCYIGEKEKAILEALFPEQFIIERDECSDEYICDIAGHMRLAGKFYANVRTQLHKAEREYSCVTRPLNMERRADIQEILKSWSQNKRESKHALFDGALAEKEALENMTTLDIEGIMVYINNEPCGVAGGFPLSEDTFDLFLSKEREHLSGLSYYVKHELFRYLEGRYRYVNVEEDLGNEGLRIMKTSLFPIGKNKMWRARRQEQQ